MSEDWLSGGAASRVGRSGQKAEVSHALWARSGCGSLGVQWVGSSGCAEDKGPEGREEVSGTCLHSLGHWELLKVFGQSSGLIRTVFE